MTFLMMRQIKGNPFRNSERAVPASIQRNLDRKFHLDKPWYEQYVYYVRGVATADLVCRLLLEKKKHDFARRARPNLRLPIDAEARLAHGLSNTTRTLA